MPCGPDSFMSRAHAFCDASPFLLGAHSGADHFRRTLEFFVEFALIDRIKFCFPWKIPPFSGLITDDMPAKGIRMRRLFVMIVLLSTFQVSPLNAQWESLSRFSGSPIAMGSLGDTMFISASETLGDTFRVFRSIDYGNTWTRVGNSIPSSDVAGAGAFATIGSTMYVASAQNGIYRSTDGGTSWVSTGSPPYLALTYSLGSNGDTLFAGYYGIAWSTDGGSSWTQPDLGPPASITTSIVHQGTALFVASQGVSRSTNGGKNWSAVNAGLPSMDTYYLATLGSALFVTIPGYGLYRSTNQGTSWQPSLTGDSVSYSTNIVSAPPYLIAGTDYAIYVSRDTGITWHSTGYSNLIQFAQLHVAGPYLYAGNLARHALANFFPAASATRLIASAGSISFNDPGEVTGVTMNLSSVVGAANVTVRRFTDPPANPSFSGPSPAYVSQYRWVISAEGAVGVSGEIRINLSAFHSGITQPSDVHIYRRSTSGSGEFVEIPTTYDAGTNELVGTITGFSEFALGSASEPLSVRGGAPSTAAGWSLDQNYPNPFNPQTTIRFTVGTAQHVKLDIYDMLGARVATLVDRTLPAGSHTASWDASGYSTGVYQYTLEIGNSRIVRRMLLVR